MTLDQIRQAIDAAGGKRKYMINWEWASFDDDTIGRQIFEQVADHCENRGYTEAQPNSSNSNLHKGGFRFR